ncbi:ABC transporter C family member 10 [Bienertia sinuspersici]
MTILLHQSIAIFTAIVNDNETTVVTVVLDVMTFLGASLLLFCTSTYKGYKNGSNNGSNLYTPLLLNGRCKINSTFAKAGWRTSRILLLTVVSLSAEPLLLNAFIKVAEGNEAFRYEGYLFYHRDSAIYKKQLRLSNIARMQHSSGEIINYVTVDAYRISEFPYWLHQTWTTCLALCILVHSMGLATVAAIAVIILTVLRNTPLAKLQHKYQTHLMDAQGARLLL